MTWWVSRAYQQDPYLLVSLLVWVPLSISLHELGHGIAAIREGDDTPVREGRMTLNPMVHMGLPSLVVFLMVGMAWGVMPVNPYRFRHGRLGEVLVAAAGPLVNLLLFGLTLTLLAIWETYFESSSAFYHNLKTFLRSGGMLNALLLLFNLLPLPPLDGATVLSGISRTARRWLELPEVRNYGFFVLVFLVWFAGGGQLLWDTAEIMADGYRDIIKLMLP